MTWYLLSKDSSPHFDVISNNLYSVVGILEDHVCSMCWDFEHYEGLSDEVKLYALLGTQCGAEFSVYENEDRTQLIKEWMLLEGEV